MTLKPLIGCSRVADFAPGRKGAVDEVLARADGLCGDDAGLLAHARGHVLQRQFVFRVSAGPLNHWNVNTFIEMSAHTLRCI